MMLTKGGLCTNMDAMAEVAGCKITAAGNGKYHRGKGHTAEEREPCRRFGFWVCAEYAQDCHPTMDDALTRSNEHSLPCAASAGLYYLKR